MRYAVLFQERPSTVASWPTYELDLLDAFFEKEPSAMDRIDNGIAALNSNVFNAIKNSGTSAKSVNDYLPHLKAWPRFDLGQYSEVDQEILQEMM